MTEAGEAGHRRPHGQDHGHHHGLAMARRSVSRRVRLLLVAVLVPFAVVTMIGMAAVVVPGSGSDHVRGRLRPAGRPGRGHRGDADLVHRGIQPEAGQEPGAVQSPLDSPRTRGR